MTETPPSREMFSYACWRNDHERCAARKCQCPCHEERPRGPIPYKGFTNKGPAFDERGPKGAEGSPSE